MVSSPYSTLNSQWSYYSNTTFKFCHTQFPEQLVSDNGSGFVSSEFRFFLTSLGIEHIQTSPHHTSSSGLAERVIQIFKSNIKKLDGDIQTRISTMFFQYCITPQTFTGLSPAEMLMQKKHRNTPDLLHPDLTKKLSEKSQQWSNIYSCKRGIWLSQEFHLQSKCFLVLLTDSFSAYVLGVAEKP